MVNGEPLLIKWTSQFKKDVRLAKRRGLPLGELEEVVRRLAVGEPLEERHRDHALGGGWSGHRECHVRPDWLLLYKIQERTLVLELTRTGTHSDIFRK